MIFCKNCKFFEKKDSTCRRFPGMPQVYGKCLFPKVKPDDWCGEAETAELEEVPTDENEKTTAESTEEKTFSKRGRKRNSK